MKIISIILIFLLIGAFYIISENNLHLKEQEELNQFVSIYVSWIASLYENSVSITGNMIKMKWLPENQ